MVHLADTCRVTRYRETVGIRVRTDGVDARLLYRYLNTEIAHLRPYEPQTKAVKRLMTLLKARAKLNHSKASFKLLL